MAPTSAPTQAPSAAPATITASGCVVASQTTLDGNKVKGPDGQTIGTLHSDGTVTDSEGKIVGLRNPDGSIGESVECGLPFASVVTSQSDVDPTSGKVTNADGHPIGHLQDDGKTIVDGEGNVVGVRKEDGSVVGGSIAGVPADSVLAPNSRVMDDGTVKGADNTTIGTLQSDGKTVVDANGKVVGTRNPDGGSVVSNGMSGASADSVVASQSEVSNGAVTAADGSPIGTLGDDGMTVVDESGNVVGVRGEDGSIVGGSIAGLPADSVVSPKSRILDDGTVVGPIAQEAQGGSLGLPQWLGGPPGPPK